MAGVILSDKRIWLWEPGREGGAWSYQGAPAGSVAAAPPAWMNANDFLRCGEYLLESQLEAVRFTARHRLEEKHRLQRMIAEFTRDADEFGRVSGKSMDSMSVILAEGRPLVKSLPPRGSP